MLEVQMKPHRQFLMANQPGQKLFLALSLKPEGEAIQSRPPIAAAFVIDTSGSMYEIVAGKPRLTGKTYTVDGKTYNEAEGGITKMHLMMESIKNLIKADILKEADQVAIIQFDDRAEVLLPFTPANQKSRVLSAVDRLTEFSGGTNMGAGMKLALGLLEKASGSRRMLLFTDGMTISEDLVREIAKKFAEIGVPVTAVGLGEEWNDDLLSYITDITQGKPFHVLPDSANPIPPSVRATDLPGLIFDEIQHAALEVVTNVELNVSTIKDVTLSRITRVYPTLNEIQIGEPPFTIGNVEKGDPTTVILEFTLPQRPPVRVRIAQLGLTYLVPGLNRRGEIPPQNLIIEYTNDQAMAASIDRNVMGYVQQRNVEGLIKQATIEARSDPEKARKTIELAKSMTQKLGNTTMTRVLENASSELATSKTISASTAKTMRIGAKTQTVKIGEGGSGSGSLTEDEIRKITGV